MTPQTPMTYVTQEMWDAAQAALREVLPVLRERVPPLSTSGTMIDIVRMVERAMAGMSRAPSPEEVDAARYRWLRDADETDVDVSVQDYNEDGATETWYSLRGEELDAAADEGIDRYRPISSPKGTET